MKSKLSTLALTILFSIQLVSAAHWIAGYVQDAVDLTSPNGRTIRLWNPLTSDEVFGIVGPTGQSGTSNVYMIDCELLATPCEKGDILNITVVDDGSGYNADKTVQVVVSGAGFDMAPNLSLTTLLSFTNLTVDDQLRFPANEIDLSVASTKRVNCFAAVEDQDGNISISNAAAKLFSSSVSASSSDDNNNHYTNSSCEVNESYGDSGQALINCSFYLEYYSQAGAWECEMNVTDDSGASKLSSNYTNVNELLALSVDSPIQFGEIDADSVSEEKVANITNFGNIKINLTLSGYGSSIGDGNAMECGANDIIIDYMKYNLSSSTSGSLTLSQFEAVYENLTSSPVEKAFNLNFRQNDFANDATNNTYWRVYVPKTVNSGCTGNIVFGATGG